MKCEPRRHHAGDAALHVDGAAPIEFAALDLAAERIVPPARSPGGTTSVWPAKRRQGCPLP